jgi:hypothetical protein
MERDDVETIEHAAQIVYNLNCDESNREYSFYVTSSDDWYNIIDISDEMVDTDTMENVFPSYYPIETA